MAPGFAKKGSVLGVSTPRGKYRRRGRREDPQGSQEAPWRGPGWGRARHPPGSLVVGLLLPLDFSGRFCHADFYIIFPEFVGHFKQPENLKNKNNRKKELATGCTELIG